MPSHYLNQCLVIVNWTLRNKFQWNFRSKYKTFHTRKCICKYRLRNGGHFVQGRWVTGIHRYCPHGSHYLDYCSPALSLTHWGRVKMVAILPDDIFKSIFLNENVWISLTISLKFVPKVPINNIPALVQATSHDLNQWWVSLLMHICVIRPQWVKSSYCNLSEDWATVDEIYRCPICKWVTEGWQHVRVAG